jgi:hypothetical protein
MVLIREGFLREGFETVIFMVFPFEAGFSLNYPIFILASVGAQILEKIGFHNRSKVYEMFTTS